mgnify:CR=1 FL=1|jgi:predicted phage-related endonuclease|tara:strand:- start:4968 stop:5957 length:990 start_codon:yes stop_codon:yes gene_type:complete
MRTSHTKIDISVSDWEARKPYIGASEAHKTLPNSEYQHTFWNEKVGNERPPDISDLPQIIRGNRIEQVMPTWIEQDYGMKVQPNTQTFLSKKYPWAIATPDGFYKTDEGKFGIEEKAPSVFNINYGDPETDNIPQYNLVQVHHTMAVMPELVGYFLFAWNENGLRRYVIKKDPMIETALMEKEDRFMGYVKENIPPPPRNDKDLVYHFFKSNKKYISNPSPQLLKDSNELYQLRKINKDNKERETYLKFKVKLGIGENAGIEYPDGKKLRMDRVANPSLQELEIKEHLPELYSKYCNQFDSSSFKKDHPEHKVTYSVNKPYTKLVFPRD